MAVCGCPPEGGCPAAAVASARRAIEAAADDTDALTAATVASLESAEAVVSVFCAARSTGPDGREELFRRALAAARASVVATTVAVVQAADDRRAE